MLITDARETATALIEYLRPGCSRIEIAGSARRAKPEVKDIEICCIPIKHRPNFGDKKAFATELDALLYNLEHGTLPYEVNPSIRLRTIKGGAKYKQFDLPRLNSVKLDVFICAPPAQWGVMHVIRTGPAEFSQWVVTQKEKRGALPDGYYVQDLAVWNALDGGESPALIEMPEEIDFLDFLGLGWIEPNRRMARWQQLKAYA